MVSAKQVATLVVAMTIAAVVFVPVANAVDSNSGTQTVTNETVTAQYDEPVELSGYDIVDGSETVYAKNSSGDYVVASSSDYTIDNGPGTINVSSSSTLIQDEEEVKVTYDYEATSDTSNTVLGLIPLMMALLILGVMAGKIQDAM